MKSFYVYIHRRSSDNRIFYVGKGMGERLYKLDNRNIHWKRIVAKHGFIAVVVKGDMSEPCALSYEKALIATIGRENLCNMTDGGDGVSGYKFTEKQRQEISRKVAAAITPEMREAQRQRRLGKPPGTAGKPVSQETRRKISEANLGKKRTDETKKKMSIAFKGRKKSLEERKAMSDRQKGKVISDETRQKISDALSGEKAPWYGKQLSEEHKAKLSKARLGIGAKSVIRSDGTIFPSAKLAALHMIDNGHPKAAPTSITATCKSKQSTAYGFGWSYAD